MSNEKVDVKFDNDSRLQAILLLGAADKLGLNPMVVETTMSGFRVPEEVRDLAFSDEPTEEEKEAKERAEADKAAREAHEKREAEAAEVAKKEAAAAEKAEQKRLEDAANTVETRQEGGTQDTSLPTGAEPSSTSAPTNQPAPEAVQEAADQAANADKAPAAKKAPAKKSATSAAKK